MARAIFKKKSVEPLPNRSLNDSQRHNSGYFLNALSRKYLLALLLRFSQHKARRCRNNYVHSAWFIT